MAIIGIPTTRVSDMFVRSRLNNQIAADQLALFKVQGQLSSGHRFDIPSEDPQASARVISLQRLLERKTQVQANLVTNASYLTATDSALSTITDMLAETRATALGVIGTDSTDQQRSAAAMQVSQAIKQLTDTGNQVFRGRYLFAGSQTGERPFLLTDENITKYVGNEEKLNSYSDIDLLFKTNMTGSEVFGAISEEVLGTADLSPVLSFDTPLSELRGGEGISKGSIAIWFGTNRSIIDISSASTVGEVARMIREEAPDGVSLNVDVSYSGINIEVDQPAGEKIIIQEVGGGTTATELGIYTPIPAGTITGGNLDPVLDVTTSIGDILGTRARAVMRFPHEDNDIIFEAPDNGSAPNGITIDMVDDPIAVPYGNDPICTYDSGTQTLTIQINATFTDAESVCEAVNAYGASPVVAKLDPVDNTSGGLGLVDADTVVLSGGSGNVFDMSGVIISNGRKTFDGIDEPLLDFSNVETVEDLLNVFNMSEAGLIAEIDNSGDTINIRSRLSSDDFSIGENGGTTASQLGIRTFTRDIRLSDLNDGYGIDAYEGGDDFTITLADGNVLTIDVTQPDIITVGDVIDEINTLSTAVIGQNIASLATVGNGITLTDPSVPAAPGDTMVVTRMTHSYAAWGLGLIPRGDDVGGVPTAQDAAQLTVTSAGNNNDLILDAPAGSAYNGVTVTLTDANVPPAVQTILGVAAGDQCVYYDQAAGTMTFYNLVDGVSTANDVIGIFGASTYPGDGWSLGLDDNDGTAGAPSTGLGPVTMQTTAATTTGGTDFLQGTDTNPIVTHGIFTALMQLQTALENNDVEMMQRAVDLLDDSSTQLSYSRAELGAEMEGLEILEVRLQDEEINLQMTLSTEYDVDMTEAISNYYAKQASYQASLQTSAAIYQLSLLDYI